MSSKKIKSILPFIILSIIAGISLCIPVEKISTLFNYNAADTGFVFLATVLVFIMTFGLAFFYGGMVHRKNILSTMMKSIVATGIVSVLWIVIGFSLSFGTSFHGLIGNPFTFAFFKNMNDTEWALAPTIPITLFAIFQMMFAIITPGLVVGAVAERINFKAYTLFILLFSIFVYAPIAHWTWHPQGILFKMGVLDFAGGSVVHISAGCAALAGAMVLKERKVRQLKKEIPPANIPYVLIGTGLLWFGWFGFNAGSTLALNNITLQSFITTNTSAAAAGLSWMFFNVLKGKKPSVLGFCIGAVVGLVAITPAAGFVSVQHSIFIGIIAAIISNVMVELISKSKIDDTLDVFPCHGIGGIVGMILTGIFASKNVHAGGADGLFFGNVHFFWIQLKGLFLVIIYSFTVSFIIFKFINFILPIRVSESEEELGLDASQHDEKYSQGTLILHENNQEKEVEINK